MGKGGMSSSYGLPGAFWPHWFHAHRLASRYTKLISAATWWEAVVLLKQLVDDEVQVNAICLTTQLPSLVGSLCRGRSDGSLRCRWQKWWLRETFQWELAEQKALAKLSALHILFARSLVQLGEENILCTFCVVCGAVQFVSGGWQVNDTDKKETNANTQIGSLSINFWPAILPLLSDLSILPFDQAFSFEFKV